MWSAQKSYKKNEWAARKARPSLSQGENQYTLPMDLGRDPGTRTGAVDILLVFGGEAAVVSRTGYLTAWARALSRRSDPPEVANQDHLADLFLLPHHRILNHAAPLTRRLIDWRMPGAIAYFNARTRHFDAILEQEVLAGIDQIVILGAGFDSRAMRFDDRLGATCVYEVDLPEVIALKSQHLVAAGRALPRRVTQVATDFAAGGLLEALAAAGFRQDARTLFLWEGVTFYLRDEDVSAILRLFQEHAGPGSTLLFDYVTRAFFEGDESGYGAPQLAAGWRKMGNVNRSGIASAGERVAAFGLSVRTDLDAAEMTRRYLTPRRGAPRRPWEVFRIAHVSRDG